MSVKVILELHAKSETVGEFVELFQQILPDTRAYDGCRGLSMHRNDEDSNVFVVLEDWDSKEHYQKYLAWRSERGDLDTLGALLAAPPNIRYFDSVDA